MIIRTTIGCFILSAAMLLGHAQTATIERLKKSVYTAPAAQEKLRALFALCDQGYSLHPDTLMKYAMEAEELSGKLQDHTNRVRAMYFESYALTNKGLIDSSLNLANRCLEQFQGVGDLDLKGNIENQKGRCYMRKSQYKEAIGMGYQVIDDAEKIKDTLLAMKGKTLIGWAYLEMEQVNESLKWHLSALHSTADTNLLEQYGILFANLALNYNSIGNTDSALLCINKAVQYSRKNENLFALSNSLAIQAQLFVLSGKPALAEDPLKEMVSIRKLIGDPFYIVSDMAQLALYYAHNGQPEKGITTSNEGIEIAKQYRLDTKLLFLYGSLAENYKAQGNMNRYAETLEKLLDIKDSVYAKNSAEAIAEMQAKYDLERKENLIMRQKLDITQKNYLFIGLLLFLVFAAVFGLLQLRAYRKNQKQELLRMQEEEKRLTAQAVMTAEENERKRIAADLHDNMGAYAAAIIANVEDLMAHKNDGNTTTLSHLKTNAAEIMNSLRETIWTLSKERKALTDITDRFKIYIQKIVPAYPGVKVEINENIREDISFSPLQALNIFRILQEAFTNALKHSAANIIRVSFESNGGLHASISDDGKGIGDSNYEKRGNGIKNMKWRAEEAGLHLAIEKNERGGTTIGLVSEPVLQM